MNAYTHQAFGVRRLLAAAVTGILAGPVQAALLEQVSVSIQNSGGLGGAGANTSVMVFNQYTPVDGWGWAGGAGGVQGSQSVTNTGGFAYPANETFKFNIGAAVDTLNATYGAGNWTVDNPTLTFNSSYAQQNNSRFGRGAGTFDIYWVGNDSWAQSKGTPEDRGLNPVYATNAAELAPWAGSLALLGSEFFSNSGTGYVNLTYSLAMEADFISDIVSASAGGANPAASLYLMATADTLGMIIFTGGQGQSLPTLSFDVVTAPVPVPAAVWLFGSALAGLGLIGRREKSLS